MPSNALLDWQNNRMRRLTEVDAQCGSTSSIVPLPDLADENLRGFVVLLSAHFQGFCRGFHSECIQAVAAGVPAPLRFVVQRQCLAAREIDKGNPRYDTLKADFERFGLDLNAALAANPVNALRITHLDHLNSARNYVAHHKAATPSGGPLALADVRTWQSSCNEFAGEQDDIMYNHLRGLLGVAPW